MSRTLHHFHLDGLTEAVRCILHYGKERYEDIQYDMKTWLGYPKIKESLPFGEVPVYEENGRILKQPLAIARYVALKANLVPLDPWEQAVLDAVVFTIYDFWAVVVAYIKEQDPKKKEAMRKEILEETVELFFSRFEEDLKKRNGHFGGKLTWADFILVAIVDSTNLFLNAEIEKKYPTVQALMKKIRDLPGVKDYYAKKEAVKCESDLGAEGSDILQV